jgi:hypothetical protein
MNDLALSTLTDSLRYALVFQLTTECLKPIFEIYKPSLSTILSISHCFCENCCDLYTPCHVNEFISTNPELYDSEIGFFAALLDDYGEYIAIDVEPYTLTEYFASFKRVYATTPQERLRQLYTLILYT